MAEEMNMGEVVMVVDDNKEIVYSISELLKYEGYRVIPAYDGMEALNLLEQNPVDLILLDVMMPRLNGLSALMKLREKIEIDAKKPRYVKVVWGIGYKMEKY